MYSPGITDFIFAIDKISELFITGPKVVKSVMFMDISSEDLGGAAIHSKKSGVGSVDAGMEAASDGTPQCPGRPSELVSLDRKSVV